MAEFKNLVKRVAVILSKMELPYVIVGGYAAILRGVPRTTTGLDLIIANVPSKISLFLDELKNNQFEVLDNQIQMAFAEGANASIYDSESALRIDLKIARKSDELEVLNSAVEEVYEEITLRVAPAEEILYGKLLYLGDISDIQDAELLEYSDIRDFVYIFHRQSELDINWLTSKAKERELDLTLQRLIKISKTRPTTQRKLL
ncbi:MAG TPA: hypothetical protein VKK79_01105 [Candidatus Lokiarchaeia archaeon]|nr:hypothetical protein [Candidatus Lokiarchaeia archaeon]